MHTSDYMRGGPFDAATDGTESVSRSRSFPPSYGSLPPRNNKEGAPPYEDRAPLPPPPTLVSPFDGSAAVEKE